MTDDNSVRREHISSRERRGILRRFWSELLGVSPDAISAESHFIFMGGDSVALFTLQARLANELGVDIPPTALVESLEFSAMEHCLAEAHR